ncbi:MAG: sensor histidine kinase [Betaproteobacteria bacterium]|nr:MAG: sensor histidine kinase [Betaproteobacteria bacterium]
MQHASLDHAVFNRFANATWTYSQRYWRFVVIAMLLLLHIAVFRGVADPWARALLLAHLGLLLLWQPFLRAEQRVSPTQGFILSLVAFAVMLRLDWWLLAFWVVIIAGLVGGKVYQHHAKWERRCYLVMLLYLLALLAIAILPEIAPRREITPEIRQAAEYALPFLFVLIALFPAEPEAAEGAQIIDFFYSVFLMLLLVVVILGSFTFMTLTRTSYLESLTYTVFLTAAAVLLVGLAWNPRAGGGLGVFFIRYLFSIGLPVERWLQVLARAQQEESRPARFLEQAIAALARLPSVAGVAWRAGSAEGERGEHTVHVVEFANGELALRIFSRYRLSPALQWHLHLLGQLLAEFYAAKLREEKLRETSYLQAVHETGARTTHDIKNLLQSLNVLCSVAAAESADSARLNALVRRQLPLVAQRLAQTLERLQRPQADAEAWVAASQWWETLARQYQGEAVEFAPALLPPSARLPRALFDSVADNLIRNALAKRRDEPQISVRVSMDEEGLRVCDTGSAVPPQVVAGLLRGPVASTNGLGIGLYQAARQAEASGYRLVLEKNADGEVCFALLGTKRDYGSTPAAISLP